MVMTPFGTQVDLASGVLEPAEEVVQRRLSDMADMYADPDAVERLLNDDGDRLIYEVYAAAVPDGEGQVKHSTTIIHPGTVGDEFHMTKGHFHTKRDRGEVYFGLSGEGYLLMQTDDGEADYVYMEPGTAAYVPPYWAHRTVNTGETPFAFFAAWPGDAGHDYGTIEDSGFAKLILVRNGEVAIVDNPKHL